MSFFLYLVLYQNKAWRKERMLFFFVFVLSSVSLSLFPRRILFFFCPLPMSVHSLGWDLLFRQFSFVLHRIMKRKLECIYTPSRILSSRYAVNFSVDHKKKASLSFTATHPSLSRPLCYRLLFYLLSFRCSTSLYLSFSFFRLSFFSFSFSSASSFVYGAPASSSSWKVKRRHGWNSLTSFLSLESSFFLSFCLSFHL